MPCACEMKRRWVNKTRHFFIQSESLLASMQIFLALRLSCKCLLRVSIGSMNCLCSLWMASIITFVLVLRHPIEGRFKTPSPFSRFFFDLSSGWAHWQHCNDYKEKTVVDFLVVIRLVYVVCVRYATVLYFLDDVEEGGETAFPIADNSTFDNKVSHWCQSFQNSVKHRQTCVKHKKFISLFLPLTAVVEQRWNERKRAAWNSKL